MLHSSKRTRYSCVTTVSALMNVTYYILLYIMILKVFVFADVVKMVTLQGKPRVSKKQLSELQFNFQIESISKNKIYLYPFVICTNSLWRKILSSLFPVCLPDSVLAFHKHGMQGRSFKNGEVTQEISDPSRTYRLLGSDKCVLSF